MDVVQNRKRQPLRAAVLGAALVAVVAAMSVRRAGPVSSIAVSEWALLCAFVLAGGVAAALLIVSWRRSRGAGIGVLILLILVLLAATLGFGNYLTPVNVASRYLAMSDGTRLALNIYLPRAREESQTLPTILVQTPYHRAQTLRVPFNLLLGRGPTTTPLIEPMVRRGFAYVTVDVRGSGASFGTRGGPHTPQEVLDAEEVVRWIVAQHWSNGKVGAEGVSYNGSAGELLLSRRHPAVEAIVPMFSMYDGYPEIVMPGGIFAADFLRSWATLTWHLDRDRYRELMDFPGSMMLGGVMPVAGDRASLARALRDHERNPDIFQLGRQIVFKDDVAGEFAPPMMSRYRETIRASGAAIFSISGWYDGAYAYAAIKRFLNAPNPGSRLLIGPWTHGGGQVLRKCRSQSSPRLDAISRIAPFFEAHLMGKVQEDAPVVQYYTMCAEQWRTEDTWPPMSTPLEYYFAAQNRLTASAPEESAASDEYRVDYSATSGTTSRWSSYANLKRLKIGYPDRRREDAKLKVYDGPVLNRDTEVTGHPVVTLNVSSSATDGEFFVYLEDVSPDGHVEYVTEGSLRALHRRLSDEAPYIMPTRYRSFSRADAQPLTPGEPAQLVIDLWPTSYLFRKGHRVRVAIAGADRDNFTVPADEPPTLRIHRDTARPSHITLPVVRRNSMSEDSNANE